MPCQRWALDIFSRAHALPIGPVHTGTISYRSTSVHSKKWYGEGVAFTRVRKKVKRSVPKQVQKLGCTEKWTRNWNDTISYRSVLVWTEAVRYRTAFRTCLVSTGDTKLASMTTWTRLIYLSSKKTSIKSQKKYKNHRQAKYHRPLKERKTLSSTVPGSRTRDRPPAYEASVLPTELFFWMRNWEHLTDLMTIYIWFVVQQMYVSLTYPFNIVQHTLSHIVEHCKLESLTTPNNIVWSTVTSCWTNNVCQFDRSLRS